MKNHIIQWKNTLKTTLPTLLVNYNLCIQSISVNH